MNHLIMSGAYDAPSCDVEQRTLPEGDRLVHTVGEVDCPKCAEVVVAMYGKPAKNLYVGKGVLPADFDVSRASFTPNLNLPEEA